MFMWSCQNFESTVNIKRARARRNAFCVESDILLLINDVRGAEAVWLSDGGLVHDQVAEDYVVVAQHGDLGGTR